MKPYDGYCPTIGRILQGNGSTNEISSDMGSIELTIKMFAVLIGSAEVPLIVLEGYRSIPAHGYENEHSLAEFLAKKFPKESFRSGIVRLQF